MKASREDSVVASTPQERRPQTAADASAQPSEELARRFHDTYERLAAQFGYETRADTKAFDPASPNGRLMIAVCAEIGMPADVERLVCAARIVAFEELTPESLRELDEASEAFADRVPWNDEPEDGSHPAGEPRGDAQRRATPDLNGDA